MERRRADGPNAAQLRGDIDAGATGDKTRGLDPAAAPMEADAEAGGAPPSADEVAQARALEARGVRPDNATAPELTPAASKPPAWRAPLLAFAALALVAALAWLAWRLAM